MQLQRLPLVDPPKPHTTLEQLLLDGMQRRRQLRVRRFVHEPHLVPRRAHHLVHAEGDRLSPVHHLHEVRGSAHTGRPLVPHLQLPGQQPVPPQLVLAAQEVRGQSHIRRDGRVQPVDVVDETEIGQGPQRGANDPLSQFCRNTKLRHTELIRVHERLVNRELRRTQSEHTSQYADFGHPLTRGRNEV